MKITYTEKDGIFYPNLALPEQTNYPIGKYGRMRLEFLKNHRKGTYTTLLTQCTLNEHLHHIGEQAAEMLEKEILKLSEKNRITEKLKSTDQMCWVKEMNNAKHCAEEMVLKEIVYR